MKVFRQEGSGGSGCWEIYSKFLDYGSYGSVISIYPIIHIPPIGPPHAEALIALKDKFNLKIRL